MSRIKQLVLSLCLLAACLHFLQAARAQGSCSPSALGPPCAMGGVASAGAVEPALNLGVGNPVNLANGNKYQRDTDLPANPGAPGIEIVRHYNSQSPEVSTLGQGWTLSYDTRVRQYGTLWQVQQADGSRLDFPGHENVRSTRHGRLERQPRGWLWQWPNGESVHFDAAGRTTRLERLDGHRIDIERAPDAAGHRRIQRVLLNGTPYLVMAYQVLGDDTYLRHIDTPLGRFEYRYTAVPGSPAEPWRLSAVVRPDGLLRRYLHNPAQQAGNLQTLTGVVLESPDGRRLPWREWAYDTHARVTQLRLPDGRRAELHYPGKGIPAGQRRLAVEDGTETWFTLQTTGNSSAQTSHLAAVTGAPCPACAPPGLQARHDASSRLAAVNGVQLQRDAAGRLQEVAVPASGWPGLRLHYNLLGQRHAWESTLTGRRSVSFLPNGLPSTVQHAGGSLQQIHHDRQGRPVRIDNTASPLTGSPPAQGSIAERRQTRLQWQGRHLAHVTNGHESEWRRYNADGQLLERRTRRDLPAEAGGRRRWTESFDYAGKLLQTHRLPEGGALHYRWHTDGRLAGIDWTNRNGKRHVAMTSRLGEPGYRYGNGMRLHVANDPGAKATRLMLQDAAGETAWVHERRHDVRGRLLAEKQVFSERYHPAGSHGQVYAHDSKDRLAASRHLPGPLPATAAGNRDAVTTFVAWNDDGSLAARSDAGRVAEAVRNAAGMPRQVGDLALEYGPGRRLARVSRHGATIAQYWHNAFGHRIATVVPGQPARLWLYLENRLVAEARADAAFPDTLQVTRRYLHAGHAVVGFIDYSPEAPDGELFAVHSDLLGAPVMVTDARQGLRWQARYTPFGAARRTAGDLTLHLRLPGQVHDPETGWHDNLLRTYLPERGHYLEPDPLGPVPGNDALGYAAQQPRTYIDPFGLLLFAFDGTQQDSSTNSNVWLLARGYLDGTAFYHPGPGTPGNLNLDALTGHSGQAIVNAQWQALMSEMASLNGTADTVPLDIIGFSRGAALARDFGNRVASHVEQGVFRATDPQLGTLSVCVDLRFMGLFDTVAQFGVLGSQNSLFDLSIAGAWQWVAHAVALQERRWLFPLSSAAGGGNVIEAPFIGAHADVGGGNLQLEDGNAAAGGDLSDVALNWMLWQARAASARFSLESPQGEVTRPVLHDERSPVARYTVNGDRAVLGAGGQVVSNYQQEHEALGADVRRETEALIARHADWLTRHGNAVGTVDMDGYARWLHDTLGWRALPA